jgi:molybdate transport system substrate-binding protein
VAAIQTLTRLGVLEAWKPALVQGESIGQAYQFVATGNASYGFIALSQVMSDGRITKGSGWIVPAHFHVPLTQDAVLLNGGRSSKAALDFLDYLKSDAARATLRSFGYDAAKP